MTSVSPATCEKSKSTSSNVMYESFYPLALVGRLLGLFPVGYFWSVSCLDVDVETLIYRCGFPSVIVFTFAITIACGANLSILHLMFSAAKLLQVGWPYFYFLMRAEDYVTFFRKWQQEVNQLLPSHATQRLLRFGRLLSAVLIAIATGYILLFAHSLYTQYDDIGDSMFFISLWLTSIHGSCSVLFLNFSSTIIYNVLGATFEEINRNMAVAFAERPLRAHRLGSLRLAHRKLSELTLVANRLNSPADLLMIVAVTFQLFLSIGSTLIVYHKDGKVSLSSAIPLFSALLLLLVVAQHCHCAVRMSFKAKAGLEHIYDAPLLGLTAENRYQVEMLAEMITKSKVQITVSGLLPFNCEVLLQILSQVVSGSLLMYSVKENLSPEH